MGVKSLIYFTLFAIANSQVFNKLINNHAMQSVNTFSGEGIAILLGKVSNTPLAIARMLGLTHFPKIIDSPNINLDRFLIDYNTGLTNEDVKLNVTQLAEKYGYSMEEHIVTTEDGYVLKLHRISAKGPIVFLMHGLTGSSDDFVIAGAESGLAYVLSRAGYDVWLGNARGNKHSKKHKYLSLKDPKFWDFSWHEIGYYDLAASIDFVLKHTDQSQLKYIGHSQGTTSFFVLLSERPEFNKKISFMAALSPVAWMTNLKSPLVRLVAPGGAIIHVITRALGLHEFFPDSKTTQMLKFLLCGMVPLADIMCSNALFFIVGFDYEQLNATNLPVIFSHMPSGGSAKQFAHYGQGIVSKDFRQYDYGSTKNIDKYRQKTPPKYKVELITVPISLVYSDADWLANPTDVLTLAERLGNVVDKYKVPNNRFNHIDYIFAKDAKELVFNRLLKLMERY